MNIDDIKYTQTFDMQLRHPATDELLVTSTGAPMIVTLSLPDMTPEYKALQSQYRNEKLRNPNKRDSAEKENARMIDLVVACTKGWNIEVTNGVLPFNANNARTLYKDDSKSWVFKQVVSALFDDANFLPATMAA